MSPGSPNALTISMITVNPRIMSQIPAEFPFQNIKNEPGALSATLRVPESFPFLEGHFPETPILPAVCIIDACMELLMLQVPSLTKNKIHLKRCRFSSTIAPNEEVFIEGTESGKDQWKFTWAGEAPQKIMAQINVHI